MAFFPCIYFCELAELNATCPDSLMKVHGWDRKTQRQHQLDMSRKRQRMFELALMMTANVELRGLRMIVENPWNEINFTNHFWFNKPSLIDRNRRLRGDYFMKPTAYWFINCQPTTGRSYQPISQDKIKRIKKKDRWMPDSANQSSKSGICSKERSMMSPDYARNFIHDFILGKKQPEIDRQLELFN
jgi:hypothetical protein